MRYLAKDAVKTRTDSLASHSSLRLTVRLFLRWLKTRPDNLMIVVANAPYDEPAGLIGNAGRIRNGRDESADTIRLPVINLEFDVGQFMTEGCQFVNQGNETIGIVHLGGPKSRGKSHQIYLRFSSES